MSDTGRNTFVVQVTTNHSADDIRVEMAQIRTELEFLLNHVSGGSEKVNIVNYLNINPPPTEECYFEEEAYAVNDQTKGLRPKTQGSTMDNWCQGQANQG